MGIGKILNQGQLALTANQTAMAVTSHNVANVNTKGYSRQRVDLRNIEADSTVGIRVGGGVEVAGVVRAASEFVNRRLEEEGTTLGKAETLQDIYTQLENIFQSEGDGGISKAMSEYFNNVRSLSAQPDSLALRTALKENAENLTAQFRRTVNSIDEVTADVNRRIETNIDTVNQLTDQVAKLNQRIMEVEMDGKSAANDERDRRDLAIRELSKIVDVKVIPTEKGGINIMNPKLGSLVVGNDRLVLEVNRLPPKTAGGPPSLSVMVQMGSSGAKRDVSNAFEGGALGGLIQARNQVVPKILDRLDQTAYQLTTNVNNVHRDAFTLDGAKGKTFFRDLQSVDGASREFGVSEDIQKNAKHIATSFEPGKSGDNRALLAIADLQDAKILDGGNSSIIDFNAGTVGTLGAEVASANRFLEQQEHIYQQVEGYRESVSGVSLDEEAINMMKFQKGFEASAKMIQVADQMMDTVLSLKRF